MRGNHRVTRLWGTTQIKWIHEISERARETKSWERLTSNQNRLRPHQSHWRSRWIADCCCVDYQALNYAPVKNRYHLWFQRCSTEPQECLSPDPNQGRWTGHNRGTGISSTKSCRLGWWTHQLHYHQAKSPIIGDKLSAEQRRLNERDDPTGCAGRKYQNAHTDRKGQWRYMHPHSGDKNTRTINIRT